MHPEVILAWVNAIQPILGFSEFLEIKRRKRAEVAIL